MGYRVLTIVGLYYIYYYIIYIIIYIYYIIYIIFYVCLFITARIIRNLSSRIRIAQLMIKIDRLGCMFV